MQNLFFIPHCRLGQVCDIKPLLLPGWTLNFEMFFYLLFAFLIGFSLRWRLVLMALTLLTLLATGLLLAGSVSNPLIVTYSNPLMLEFLTGMAIAYVYLKPGTLPASVSALLVGLGVVLVFGEILEGLPRVITYGIPATLVVLGVAQLEKAGYVHHYRLLQLLGDASYSTYLSHVFTLGVLRVAWQKFDLIQEDALSAYTFAGLSLVIVAVTGWVVYRRIERPLGKACHRLYAWLGSSGLRSLHEQASSS